MMREQDQYMPIVNVIIIIPWILLPHAKISDQAKETIQDCVSDYICSITSEANQQCQQEQCKTVTTDDLLWAMRSSALTTTWALSLYLQCYRKEIDGLTEGLDLRFALTSYSYCSRFEIENQPLGEKVSREVRKAPSFSGPLMLPNRASANSLSAPIKSSGGLRRKDKWEGC
ncbi:hypothetical protein K1719_012061 [Acacia pycnantha]|nr:hypothetical protein K1719_012061 [Acacia pycnantha]